jgi:hypothetical protein
MQSADKKITVEKSKDSGLALVLICLICFLVWEKSIFLLLAIFFLVVAMTYPPVFKPFARAWFGLSTVLGTIVSKIILSLLFYGLVLPVGLVRRVMGKDAMQIKSWKKGQESVFRVRDHRFTGKDLENPY